MSDPNADVKRLHDMIVEEVSLVDRAANKRRFLVTKRRGEMENNVELQPDGKGGLVATEPKPETESAQKVESAGDPAEIEKAKNSGAALQSAVERLMSAANKIKEGTDPGSLADELKGISTAILGVIEQYPSPESKKTEPASKADTAEESVEKRGATMRKERLERFKSAVQTLAELLKEIVPSDEIEPSAGSAAAEPTTKTAPVEIQVTPSEDLKALMKAIESLTTTVASQGSTIDKITKATPPSSQVAVEPKSNSTPKVISWPLDLNNPVDRDHVAKDVSFHDA